MKYLLYVLGIILIAMIVSCGSTPVPKPGQNQESSQKAPEIKSEGDVESESVQKSSQDQEHGSAESGDMDVGKVEGGISQKQETSTHEMDQGTERFLTGWIERNGKLLGKAVGSVLLFAAGLMIVLLYAPSPDSTLFVWIGQAVGLAVAIGGPLLLWLS